MGGQGYLHVDYTVGNINQTSRKRASRLNVATRFLLTSGYIISFLLLLFPLNFGLFSLGSRSFLYR